MKTVECFVTTLVISLIRKIALNSFTAQEVPVEEKRSPSADGSTLVRLVFLSIRSEPFAIGVHPFVVDKFKKKNNFLITHPATLFFFFWF